MSLPTGSRVGNLPFELSSFVGRRSEVAEVKRLLSAFRLVTLTGFGGVGKTRLALRVAADVSRAFTDGVWLIELGEQQDDTRFTETVAGALGIETPSATRTLEALTEYLAPRQLLLVLDNCEHVVDGVAAPTAALLRKCPRLRILATSRETLAIAGEAALPLRPLTFPDPDRSCSAQGLSSYEAVRLFIERACAAVPGFGVTEDNKAVVARICQRLDGLPLPIELAAAGLRVLSAQQILLRLSDRYRPLSIANRGTPARQQSLRLCIDWSHELCTAREREVWRKVSVFTGGFELDGAEALCAGEFGPNELLEVLAALVNKSILIPEQTHGVIRYRLLETVRDYGRDRLRESGEYSTLQRRHRDWFEQLTVRAHTEWLSPRQAEWTTRLERELPNLRDAMTYCLADPIHAPVGLQIANALRRFWISRGLLSEGRQWLRRALTSQVEQPTRSQVTALCTEGMLAALQGEGTDPFALVAKARKYAAGMADPILEQLVTRTEGQLALSSGDAALAVTHFEKVLDACRASEDLDTHLEVLLGLGVACGRCGDRARAMTCFEEILAITEPLGETVHQAQALAALGSTVSCTDPVQATQLLTRGLQLSRSLNSPSTATSCLSTCAWIAATEHRTEHAAVLMGAIEKLGESTGAKRLNRYNINAGQESSLARLRLVLGERAFSKAVQQGRGLSLRQAVAYALGESTAAGDPPRSGPNKDLTPRERQVADLVAQGLTNRVIADKLVISQRTAQGHVEHILAKLGFVSRAQIAAWVAPNAGER